MTIGKLMESLRKPENETALIEIFNDYAGERELRVGLFHMEEINDHVDGDVRSFWVKTRAAEHFDIDDKYCMTTDYTLESSNSVMELLQRWIDTVNWDFILARWLLETDQVDDYWIDE